MKADGRQKFFWLGFAAALFPLLLIQTAFWPDFMERRHLIPNMAVPPLLYVSLYYGAAPSVWLAVWLSLLSGALSFLPLSQLAPAWLLVCASAWASQALYFKKKGHLFFSLAFFWGFALSALAGSAPPAPGQSLFALDAGAAFAAAFATLTAAGVMYPAFKICFKMKGRL